MEKEQEAQVLKVLVEIDKKLDTIVDLLDILVTVAKKAAALQNI